VDYNDFLRFAADYLKHFVDPPYPTTDVDWDGDVDFNDFLRFVLLYGKSLSRLFCCVHSPKKSKSYRAYQINKV